MKQFIALISLVLVVSAAGYAQGNSRVYLLGSSESTDIWAVTNWGPFSSDSSALVFSGTFPVADYDSVQVWGYGSSSTGTAKWSASLWAGFANAGGSTLLDSLGACFDTTSAKTEVMVNYGSLVLDGAAVASFRVSGATEQSDLHNPADAKVYLYAVGFRRANTGAR